MKRTANFFTFVLALALLFVFTGEAVAEGTGNWKWDVEASTEASHISNLYKLSDEQADRLEAELPADKTSGRYTNMDSVDDILLTPGLKIKGRLPGSGSSDLYLKAALSYNIYTKNGKKSYPKLALGLKKEIGSNATVGLDMNFAFQVFKKNLLAGSTDMVGPVSQAERIYKPANFDDFSVEVNHSRRLWKAAKSANSAGPSTLRLKNIQGEAVLGGRVRKYDSPFKTRDETAVFGGVQLDLNFNKDTVIALGYALEYLMTTPKDEFMIRDEPDFGISINADADATDLNVPAMLKADRTRFLHTASASFSTKLPRKIRAKVKYEARIEDFQTSETFDITRQDRSDLRHKVGVSLSKNITEDWSVGASGTWTYENADRGALADIDDEESKTYDNYVTGIVVTRKFK